MSQVHNLRYIGKISAVVADGKTVGFVTEHVENQATALYLIDGESSKLSQVELPCGGKSLARIDDVYWIGGSDGNLYVAAVGEKSARKLSTKLPTFVAQIVKLSKERVGLLTGESVTIVNAKGKVVQSLELEETASALAASPAGDWLAVGTNKGTVTVFQAEEQDDFEVSDSASLHSSAVTSILFEPEELRFLSTGADRKLFLTHARGTLEPEDRGRANNHEDNITAMVLANEVRFITGSDDKSCKSWALTDKTKPATLSEGVIAVVDLAIAEIHKRQNLVVACSDDSLRLFLLDEDGRFGAQTTRYNDGYVRASQLLDSSTTADRGNALQELAEYGDQKSVEMISARVENDPDHKLRLTAVKLLTKSAHPNLDGLLEAHLHHADGPVRLAVFESLESRRTSDLIPLYESTLKTNKGDTGVLAIKGLEKIARDEKQTVSYRNRSQHVLTQALENDVIETQQAAMFSLERVFDNKSAKANLLGLDAKTRTAQAMGLIRIFQRGLLKDDATAAGLRKGVESREPGTRQTAFLVSLMTRPKLLEAVRARDKDIHRLVHEIESISYSDPTKKKPGKTDKAADSDTAEKSKALPKTKKAAVKLTPDDYAPLLLAISSRRVETCLLGARCLALLEDPRVFGVLMQLSGEEEASVRVQVCRSFGNLKDTRALERLCLLLSDADVSVRDAAYSALENICAAADSLDAIVAPENGLSAQFPDIRLRALQSLVKLVRKSKSKSKQETPAVKLLKQALSDKDAAVRSEAFKVILNSQVGGGGEATLRIAMTSIHADVRREVFSELLAEEKQDWAQTLMLEMLNDPDPEIRQDAFEYLDKKHESDVADDDIVWLQTAISSSHTDTREAACKKLIKHNTPEAQELLLAAIDDESSTIRLLALKSLISTGATKPLVAAMDSQYVGVRLAAATALARQGDSRSQDVLLQVVNQPWPEEEHARAVQKELVQSALAGLRKLAEPATLDAILKHTGAEDADVRQAAANALRWIVTDESLESVRPLLQHDDQNVQSAAAMAMSLAGDPVARNFVFSNIGKQKAWHQLMVAVAAGDAGERQLVRQMDGYPVVANAAFLVLVFREWLQPTGTPSRLIACLGTRDPRLRLLAARGLQAYSDAGEFAEFISYVVNDRGDQKSWDISDETIATVAKVVCRADAKLAARVAELLTLLNNEKQARWDQPWSLLQIRAKSPISKVAKAKIESKAISKKDAESLDQLVFGTYVGLAREQGGTHHRYGKLNFGRAVFQIRCEAIRRLQQLAATTSSFLKPAISVVTHTCGDPILDVRMCAFETLKEMGVDDTVRAQIGIDSGHFDLGKLGLDLLGAGTAKDRQAMLKQTILTRSDNIAVEAANRLKQEIGATKVSEICFDSPNIPLPVRSVSWLGEDYDSQPAAVKKLRQLAKDAADAIRSRAISVLVTHKDKDVFAIVCEHFKNEQSASEHNNYYKWLENIGDPKTSEFLIPLLADPEFETDDNRLLKLAASFRNAKIVPELIALFDSTVDKDGLVQAITTISGFDQPIEDENDLLPHRDWMQGQHSRDGKILAQLIEAVLDYGPAKSLTRLIRSARWCESAEVDAPLARLLDHPDDEIRQAAVGAYAFRTEKRKSPTDPLVTALGHRDPITQYWAAEGLAKAGNNAGFQVLMTTIDLMEDLWYRQRAVLALGYLADERTLEKLLLLISEEGHALQMVAAEAIGHLGNTDKRPKILKILQGFIPREGTIAARAIVGLRWLDDPEAWQTIRERVAQKPHNDCRREAIKQLGYNADPETHDLLLDQLEHNRSDKEGTLQAARRSFGDDSLQPDVAYLKGRAFDQYNYTDLDRASVDRICESGETSELFEVIGKSSPMVQQVLNRHLLTLTPLPIKEAITALAEPNSQMVKVAAHIIGKSADKKHVKAIQQAMATWLERFAQQHEKLQRLCLPPDDELNATGEVVEKLIWASGRVGGMEKELLKVAASNDHQNDWLGLRRSALSALQSGKVTAAMSKDLEGLSVDFDAHVRELAAQLVLQGAKKEVAAKMTDNILADRVSTRHLLRFAKQKETPNQASIDQAAASAHYQPRVLGHMVSKQDVKTLSAVATDVELADTTRLGAIEGLARMGSTAAEKKLVAIGKDDKLDESLRKAAWRGLRRSKRLRAKTESKKD